MLTKLQKAVAANLESVQATYGAGVAGCHYSYCYRVGTALGISGDAQRTEWERATGSWTAPRTVAKL